MKKDAKYKKLDLRQSKLKSKLHEDRRSYYSWKVRESIGDKTKAPVTMAQLESQQAVVNKIREQIKKTPTSIVEDLKKTVKSL